MGMLEVAKTEASEQMEQLRRRNMIISAFANLSTTYNLVNINLAHVCMMNEYCGGSGCAAQVTSASTACLAGAISGQLLFGYVGDCLGRGPAMQLTMWLSILGALASAFVAPVTEDRTSVFYVLSVTRFVLGVGVGGVYPLSATMAAESAKSEERGKAVSLVFSMQGVGTVLVPLVGALFLSTLGDVAHRQAAGATIVGLQWRLILGVGAIPGLALMPFQLQTQAQARETERTSPQKPSRAPMTMCQALRQSRYWPKLIGCAGGWFLFDITFYGNTLFSPTVLKDVFHPRCSGKTPTWGPTLEGNLCWQLAILALIGLPGYYLASFLMDILGRKIIQLQGFFFMGVVYATLGFYLEELQNTSALLLFVYGLTYFFSNFGPNSTTFILPSETFPEDVRSSLNGVSAAMGKLGATVGAATFKPIQNAYGAGTTFGLCAGVAFFGALLTVIFVEDRRGLGMETGSSIENQGASDLHELEVVPLNNR
eukprot:TRINITY_DN44936_c0_g1_i1.p1 TRINITY_DN44936_c0_g1~~TRINITY_DN44936_c0_g1_i1.p1  ORF type:complete len:483 (+),score=52.35 TRINITY_DN44936_c0_g1_i1:114-1562(+)